MKTIELLISGQKAQFTTRSVTFDGKEYLYSHITKLDHSPVVRTYRFEYDDGDTKLLTYEKKDAKLLAAIFSQVHKMVEVKKAKAAEQPEAPAKAEEPAKVEAPAEDARGEESANAEVQEDAKAEAAEEMAENENSEAADEKAESGEKEPVDPEKQTRIKKSFKIFGIVIAAVIAAAIIYYFVFGTSNAPTETNPNITESQQYEDIDQLIDDLQ